MTINEPQSSNGKVLAVLHAHPHFFDQSPETKKRLDARIYTRFFPIPSLLDILMHGVNNGIGILALSACHPSKDHTDNRFAEYMKELPLLEQWFDIDPHLDEGWLALEYIDRSDSRGRGAKKQILIHTQETRTSYRSLA